MNRLLLLATTLSALLFAGMASAQSWSELNASQQQQLTDFQAIWSQLPDNRRAQLVGSAEQIARMSPANRNKLVDSMRQAASGNNPSNPSPQNPQ